MGVTYVTATAIGPKDEETLEFLVDSGSTYSVLPDSTWRTIGLEPTRVQRFSLADGTMLERKVSECRMLLPQGSAYSPVVLGEPGDEALLGVVTLENLGLILNPFSRELQPMRLLLA